MTATIWISVAILLSSFILSYILETWWMIGWASYLVAKAKITYKRLAK